MSSWAAMAGLICVLVTGCVQQQQSSTPTPSANISELSKLVKLPAIPSRGQWEVVQRDRVSAPGPRDWAVVAVLTFDPVAVKQILMQSGGYSAGKGFGLDASYVRPWLPEALRGQFSLRPDRAAYAIQAPLYKETLFAKSPLLNGFICPVPGTSDQLFLFLYTM